MTTDANGYVLLPKWFLGFLSVVLMLLTVSVIPWAASVTRHLGSLANEVTALKTQFEGRTTLQNAVIQNINERVEQKLDRLEQRQMPVSLEGA